MRKFSKSKKVAATLLSVLFFCSFLFSISAVALMASNNFYNHSYNRMIQDYYADKIFTHLYRIIDYYEKSTENLIFYTDPTEYYEHTNFAFTVIDGQTHQTIASTYDGENIAYEDNVYLIQTAIGSTIITSSAPHKDQESHLILVAKGYIITDPSVTDDLFSAKLSLYKIGYSWKYPMIAIAFVSFAALALLIFYLFCAIGHHPNEKEIRSGILEKIPLDIFTAIYLIAVLLFVIIVLLIIGYGSFNILTVSVLMFLGIVAYLITLMYTLSFALRIKCGGILKNLLLYRICRWIVRKTAAMIGCIPLIWKTLIGIFLYVLSDWIVLILFDGGWDNFLIFYVLKNLIVAILLISFVIALKKLQKGGEKIASGDLSYQMDTSHLFGDYKKFAHTLNSISDSMSVAVEERIKSERMKTELITNVSHDIKTPLTSIINYVDLLKKEKLENPTAEGYLDILESQSLRLKKLICDLVEVSKASTGNIQVNAEEFDVCVLLQQAVGEYHEKLKKAHLEAVTHIGALPLPIVADGNLLWRVFDNLLGNICKYSMPGTRVYLDAFAQDGRCYITFKNISKAPLEKTSEELLERFVRDDLSRNTEGSGLGLPIAKSLLELQGGTLDVSTDGDLFKATVSFPFHQ